MALHEYSRDFIGRCITSQDAFAVLRSLCEDIGQRLSASDEEKRAVEMAVASYSRCGYETGIEEFSYTGWRPGTSTVVIRENGKSRQIPSHPLGWGPGASISAPFVDVGRGMKHDMETGGVRGRIVLVCSENPPEQRDIHRSHKYSYAEEAGAAGFLFYDKRLGGLVGMGSVSLEPRVGKIPAVGISYEDAMYIKSRQGNATIEIACTSRSENVVSRNGIGLKRGRTPEEIIVCGHADSWFSPGAVDNGTGTAMVVELARLLQPYHLDRSVRFVNFGSEEVGLLGSKAYLRAHEDLSPIVCVLNLDCSAIREGVAWVCTNENPRLNRFMTDITQQLHLGLECSDRLARYSDHFTFWENGVPGAAFLAHNDRYAFGHSDYDSLDKVSPECFTIPLLMTGVVVIECAMNDVTFRPARDEKGQP